MLLRHRPSTAMAAIAALTFALTGCATGSGGERSDLAGGASVKTVVVPKVEPRPQLKEIRGVWLTNVDSDVLASRAKIAEAMQALREAGINVVYPVVWNKAMTMYPSDHAATLTGIRIDPKYGDRDPLRELIVEAHSRGIEVVPWFEYGFATSYNTGGGIILQKKPHWAAIGPDGKLVKKNNFEWMNAFDPEVQEFMTGLILEVVRNYDVDGIQGDDRLPALPTLAGYDEKTKARYKRETGRDAPANIKDEHWVRWRANILTEYLSGLRARVKAIDPNVIVSSSPSYYDWSLYEYLQDSYTWTNRGLVDSIHPQAYRKDIEAYKKIVDELVANQFTKEQLPMLAPGLLVKSGSYIVPEDHFREAIAYNRAKGVNGEVFFFYEGLRANNSQLLNVLKTDLYKQPAALPYRDQTWRPGGLMFAAGEEANGTRTLAPNKSATVVIPVAVPRAGTYDVYTFADPDTAASRATVTYVFTPLPAGQAGALRIDADKLEKDSSGKTMASPLDVLAAQGLVDTSLLGTDGRVQSVTIRPANALQQGWVKVATVPLQPGRAYEVRAGRPSTSPQVSQERARLMQQNPQITPAELDAHVYTDTEAVDSSRTATFGPVMLLLNRRLSPDTRWE